MKKFFFITILCCLVAPLTIAQRGPDRTLAMGNNISAITQSELTGTIVIKEGENIRGIDADAKTEKWKVTKDEIGGASVLDVLADPDMLNFIKKKESIKAVPGTPYIEGLINYKFVLINSETGKLVYNSANEKFAVITSQLLYESNEYLFFITEDKKIKSLLIDLKTGNQIWKTEIGDAKSFASILTSALTLQKQYPDKAMAYKDKIYMLNYGILSCLDRLTGKLMWRSTDKYSVFYPTQNGSNIVVAESVGLLGNKQELSVLNVSTGKGLWDSPIKTKYIVYVEDWGDKLLVAHYSGFNFFDLKIGQKIWKKDARGDMLKRVIPIGNDYLYVAENEMMLIDQNGEKIWKKFIEICDNKEDEIMYLDKVDEKVFYLTSSYGNMVDYKSGAKLWKRNIKFNEKRPVLSTYDKVNDLFLVYNDEKLYKFDPNGTDKPEPFAEVNIKNENEVSSIDLFGWGVSLTGQVELMGVDMTGKVKYHNVYKQPGEGTRQLSKGAATVGGIALGAKAVGKAIAGSEWRMTYRDENGVLRESVVRRADNTKLAEAEVLLVGAENLFSLADKFSSRFKAMKQNSANAFVFAKGENKEKLLIKVRKEDGKELDKISFANDRPEYEIDPVTDNIFYVNGNSLLVYESKK
jgi:outer membrane protein assembly factor BamB